MFGDAVAPALQPDLPRLRRSFVPAGGSCGDEAVANGVLQADAQHGHAVAFANIHAVNGGLLRELAAQGADVGQTGRNRLRQDEATLNIDHARRGATAEAKHLAGIVPGEAGTRAVMPRVAADGGQGARRRGFADAGELLQPDAFFEAMLRGIARVLQRATAAVVVMGAGGNDAVGRGGKNLYGFGFEKAFFVGGNAGDNALAGQGAADKGGFAVASRNAAGVVVEAVNVKGERFHGGQN